MKTKKKDSPVATPIQTPVQTPDRPIVNNSFAALQSESEGEENKSVDTITADDSQVEIDSAQSDDPVNPPAQITTPEEIKRNPTSIGPIAAILPTDLDA